MEYLYICIGIGHMHINYTYYLHFSQYINISIYQLREIIIENIYIYILLLLCYHLNSIMLLLCCY